MLILALQSGWRGPRKNYVAGGLHMTHTSFLPNAILKRLSATERSRLTVQNFHTDLYQGVDLADLDTQQASLYSLDYVQVTPMEPQRKLRGWFHRDPLFILSRSTALSNVQYFYVLTCWKLEVHCTSTDFLFGSIN